MVFSLIIENYGKIPRQKLEVANKNNGVPFIIQLIT